MGADGSDANHRHVFLISPGEPLGHWVVEDVDAGQKYDFGSKDKAIYIARACGAANKPSQVNLQGSDGTIEAEWNYGND